MSKIKMVVWGRELEIDVVYDIYRGETVLKSQEDAYSAFMSSFPALLQGAETEVKKFCLSMNKEEIGNEITNIFKYVKPKTLYIKRTDDTARVVALLCAYKFNPDDGLALVFKNEQLSEIGTENIVL